MRACTHVVGGPGSAAGAMVCKLSVMRWAITRRIPVKGTI